MRCMISYLFGFIPSQVAPVPSYNVNQTLLSCHHIKLVLGDEDKYKI